MRSREAVLPESRQDPEEFRLADYVAIAWRLKGLLVLAALVAGATAFAVSLSGPRVYESTVTFAAIQSKIGEGGVSASTAIFRPMVESLSTASAVIQEVGLDKDPYRLRPSEFLDRVMSVNEVRGTTMIRVTVVFSDPGLSARIANSVAAHAVQVAKSVNADEAVQVATLIKQQVDLAKARFDEADARLRAYRQGAQIEAVKKDVEAMLGQRAALLPLLVSVQTEKARLARLDEELLKRDRIDTIKKTIDSEPVLDEALRARAQGTGSTLGMQLRSEEINGVYQGVDAAAATSRANLAALERQKAELVDVRRIDAGTLPLLTRLYEREAELARFQVERDLAEKIYVDLSQRYEVSRLQVAGRSAELQIIDPAVPADRPVSRQVARNTVVGAVAGLCVALAAMLVWHAALAARRRPALVR